MDIALYIKDVSKLIDKELNSLIPLHKTAYASLFEAAHYSLFSGGKRLRPIIAVAVAEMFLQEKTPALQPACALELVHVYSLIHDDLPCMDNDDFRRGKPTLHKVYNEGHAVLTGDFLLSKAFETLATAPFINELQKLALITNLSAHCGGHGMIAGQVLDISFTGRKIDLPTLELIHNKKTAAMITAAFEFGGIIGKASETEMEILHQLGQHLGLAFQIVDDILDTTQPLNEGKKRNSDQANGKITYTTQLGIERSKEEAERLLNHSQDLLASLPYDTALLSALIQLLINRQK